MIHESYLGNWRKLPPRGEAEWIAVTRTAHSVLAPSRRLLNDWKHRWIDWAEYMQRFRAEILNNPDAIQRLREILELAKTREVYLLCYEKALDRRCHRFLLLDMLKEMNVNGTLRPLQPRGEPYHGFGFHEVVGPSYDVRPYPYVSSKWKRNLEGA